jgi:hypothetical protein
LKLLLIEGTFAVCRLGPADAIPAWAGREGFSSITRTEDELSVVCAAADVPGGVRADRGWRCLRVAGTQDLSQTGVLSSIAAPLAAARVSLFAVATYDTDYVLVRDRSLGDAIAALRAAGHEVHQA